MNNTNLQFQKLIESAAHWLELIQMLDGLGAERIYKEELIFSEHCPCCEVWLDQDVECSGCPISDFTGQPGCCETPWITAKNILIEYAYDSTHKPVIYQAFTEEYQFLLNLAKEL